MVWIEWIWRDCARLFESAHRVFEEKAGVQLRGGWRSVHDFDDTHLMREKADIRFRLVWCLTALPSTSAHHKSERVYG